MTIEIYNAFSQVPRSCPLNEYPVVIKISTDAYEATKNNSETGFIDDILC